MARRPLPARLANLNFVTHQVADLTSLTARRHLSRCDVLIHLGFQLWRRPGERPGSARWSGWQANREGTLNVLRARPSRVVLASSAAVYGAHPDNPLPLSETDPVRPNPECSYAFDKIWAEQKVLEGPSAAVLRFSALAGSQMDGRAAQALRGYRLAVPAISGCSQALQFMDESDAANALWLAAVSAVDGVFNIAPPDWMDEKQLAQIAGGRVVRLPDPVVHRAAEIGFRLGLLPFGSDRSCFLSGPIALDSDRARAHLGFVCRMSSAEVLADNVGWRRGGASPPGH